MEQFLKNTPHHHSYHINTAILKTVKDFVKQEYSGFCMCCIWGRQVVLSNLTPQYSHLC